MKLVDSSVVIDYLRDDERAVGLVERLFVTGEWVGASEITRFEILAGVRAREEKATETFLLELEWVPVDEAIARRGAALARSFRRSHGGIEDGDYLIAATAIELDAELLTTNVRHFPMLPDLQPAY